MRTRHFLLTVGLLALAAGVVPPVIVAQVLEVRVVGEYRGGRGETPEAVMQLAVLDAERKAVAELARQLREHENLRTLQLSGSRIEAYLAGTIDFRGRAGSISSSVPIAIAIEAGAVATQVAKIHRDQDAARTLVGLFQQRAALENQIAGLSTRVNAARDGDVQRLQREQQLVIDQVRLGRLAAQVAVALARTEESAVGGRITSPEQVERARLLADEMAAQSPDSPTAHLALGDVLLARRQVVAAEAEYRRALLLDSGSSLPHIKLGSALALQQKTADAIVEFREAVKLDPTSVRAHTSLGAALRAQRNIDEAMAEYREAIRLDPTFIEARNGLAVALAGRQQLEEAVAEFREIVRIDPESALGFYNLSFALADLDKDEESAAALREVIRINPNHYNARYNLGELFRLEDKFDESAKQFREYLRLVPDIPQNQRNIERARMFVREFENP